MNFIQQKLRQSPVAQNRFLKNFYWKALGTLRQYGLVAPVSPIDAGLTSYRQVSGWNLDPKSCPCDIQFLEYLQKYNIQDQSIFHFGTGKHHVIGQENQKLDKPNEILGITASRPEHEAYVKMVLQQRGLDRYYKVLFCDIYTLSSRSLSNFDIVSLFHLCEFYLPDQAAFTHHDDASLLDLFLQKLNPNGRVIFYNQSNNWSEAQQLIDAAAERGEIEHIETYKNLLVYRRK